MPRSSKFEAVVPGAVFALRESTRKIVGVTPLGVTYEQMTATQGPGRKGETRTITHDTFYNWLIKARKVA